MPKASSALAMRLVRRLRAIERTRERIECLADDGKLTTRDVHLMYEAMFMKASTLMERFIEDLFLGLLPTGVGVQSSYKGCKPRIQVPSVRIARRLVLGTGRGSDYVDWFPYDRATRIADLFFVRGIPFSFCMIEKHHRKDHFDIMKRMHYIRNAIAHNSAHSMRQFHRHVIQSTKLPPAERKPAGYLRGKFRTNPDETRLTDNLFRLGICAMVLAK
jgi:hypothetical protein